MVLGVQPRDKALPIRSGWSEELPLAQGGCPDGFEIELMCNGAYPRLGVATMMQKEPEKVGIKAKLRPGEEEALYALIFGFSWDVFVTRFNGGCTDRCRRHSELKRSRRDLGSYGPTECGGICSTDLRQRDAGP